MDHSHMDHGSMGHGHMDHGDTQQCSMNMLFNWDTRNLCLVFPQWRITGTFSLLLSLLGVVLLCAGYELVRSLSRRYETSSAEYLHQLPPANERPRSWTGLGKNAAQAEKRTKIIKAVFYAAQVFYSFFIMLLFMTYNGWVMIAVAVGAFAGYLAFGEGPASKTVACH